MAHWVEHLGATGRTEYLFELEMWLRSFERYFRIRNQPISEDSARMLAIRSFYEEIGLVANGIQRVTELCTLLSSEDQVSQERFDKYVENYLKKDEIADPYVARLLRQKSPTAGLTLLRESLEDVKLVLTELTKLSRIPFATFQSVGRILYREIYRNDYLALLLDQRFKPAYDRITAEPISELIRRMENPDEKRLVARVFLHFFRLLHYLEYADPRRRHMEDLRTTVLVFSLVASETRSALDFLQRQRSSLAQGSPFADVLDSFDYCIPLELRKVINTELIDVTAFKQPDAVYMRIENSHGILRDCFQQSVIQLAKGFDPTIEGQQIFDHFATRLRALAPTSGGPAESPGGGAKLRPRAGRRVCRAHEEARLSLLRQVATFPHVPRLEHVRVLHRRDPAMRQPLRAPTGRPPFRYLRTDPPA